MIPLHFKSGHLFLEIDGHLWLFDTGAPLSFGSKPLFLAERDLRVQDSYMSMTAESLSRLVSVDCVGLLGADVLGQFDFLLDLKNGTAEVSLGHLEHNGIAIALEQFMEVPVVSVRIGKKDYRMFFDTGAQVSFFQHDSLVDYAPAGKITDFYPGFGQFETETYHVDIELGDLQQTLRCGALPGILGTLLMAANTTGIIGNSIMQNRLCGYFPRRNLLVL